MKAIWSSGSLRRSIWVCPRVSPIDTVICCNVFWGGWDTHPRVILSTFIKLWKKPFGYCRCGAHGWCKVSNDYCFFGSCLGFNQMVMWMILEITNQLFSSGDFPYMAPKNLGTKYFINQGWLKPLAVVGKCWSNGSIIPILQREPPICSKRTYIRIETQVKEDQAITMIKRGSNKSNWTILSTGS